MNVRKQHLLALLVVATASVEAVSADLAKAKQNYERYCAACHGFNGMSLAPGTPNLRMNEGLIQPDLQILQKLKMGSPKKAPMLGILNDQELLDVITYSRTIR
jgi:mono/diheme cytochrome c family protein